MKFAVDTIEIFFTCALFFNALLFVPQAIKIWKAKSSKGVSLMTFLGFNVIQLLIILHGVLKGDCLLVFGYLLSLITCGAVTVLIVYFRGKENDEL